MGLNFCYTIFILSCIGICVQAWSPYFKKDIDCIEMVQCRATKIVCGFRNLKYEDRQYKRMKGDMIETYKIISGLEDVNVSQSFVRSSMDNLQGHSLKLYTKHFRKVIH